MRTSAETVTLKMAAELGNTGPGPMHANGFLRCAEAVRSMPYSEWLAVAGSEQAKDCDVEND